MIGRRSVPSTQEAERPKGFDDFELKLGDIMRGERATLAKSLLDVQRELRIKASYIAAIESADLSTFDTPSFVAGYVRSYARYLGLDPDWAFERFCEETGFQPVHGMAPAASGVKTMSGVKTSRHSPDLAEALANPNATFIPKQEPFWSRIDLRAVGSLVVLAVLAGGIGYGGWTVLKEVQRVQLAPVDQAPGVVAEIDPIDAAAARMQMADNDTLPDAPATEALDRLYRPQALDTPVLIARDGPIASIDPNQTGLLARSGSADQHLVVQNALMQGPMPAGEQLAAAAPAPGEGIVRTMGEDAPEVEVLAVRPAWVRIKAADGSVLLEKIMDAGERFAVPKLEQPPVMRIGESGAIYFAVNGVAHGPAGRRGVVTKNVVLTPESLDEKFSVADLSSDGDLAKMVAVADAGAVVPVQSLGE
ncbi:helix-turn-helix domain-containing protein [Sinirhodobacter populi]|uniref:Helix-turn-helix domain-containing protein n=1 Tax=Paenirhodobacter populi TaxID=2306993 RepID=A0A443KFT6_9RHOB|nr:helix-turn-helix domain-containing protein [Sinirhodobacter populi]RWR31619.1 helix-turn-helix domain-containing protein [Sinirhodobacter populi]